MERLYLNDKEIITMAEKFRKRSCYKCQFLYSDDLITENLKYQSFTQEGDTEVLYKNMRLLGLTDEIWVNEALICHFVKAESKGEKLKRSPTHHIIPKSVFKKTSFQKILKERNLDIIVDDGRNGIILPNGQNRVFCFSKGTAHTGDHTDDYKAIIERRIEKCTSEQTFWEIVDEIKEDLYKGSLHIQNDHFYNA